MNRKKLKAAKVISILLIVCTGVYFYFANVVNPVIINYSEAKVKSLSNKAVNSAVHEVVGNTILYDNLINVETDNDGRITLIQANAIEMNSITKDLIKISQMKIELMGAEGVQVPLGSFTGLPLLYGFGPLVDLRLMPIGTIKCSFKSEFTEAGINQTNHKIYITVETAVKLLIPTKESNVTTDTQILLCESIIVGDIPDSYFSGNLMGDAIDLIP